MKHDNGLCYHIKTYQTKLKYKLSTLDQLMSGLKSENKFYLNSLRQNLKKAAN